MNDDDMTRAEIWLHDRLKQHPNIESLAMRLGYSVSQVRRNFKNRFGLTPGAYRDRLKLERAALLLGTTEYHVSWIAKECGYYNHSAFSRAFQHLFHCNPRVYRESFRRRQFERYNLNPFPFRFTIKHLAPRYALLARRYGYQDESLAIIDWQHYARLLLLEQRGLAGKPFWVIQDHPDITAKHRIRVDYGLLIDATTADELAPPLPFRIVKLPACRNVCLKIGSLCELDSAYLFLQAQGLPIAGESPDGSPGTLTWLEGEPGENTKGRIEVSLPVAGSSA
nr:AraC family transcriptional regulator [uncultured Halomonas sp.]